MPNWSASLEQSRREQYPDGVCFSCERFRDCHTEGMPTIDRCVDFSEFTSEAEFEAQGADVVRMGNLD